MKIATKGKFENKFKVVRGKNIRTYRKRYLFVCAYAVVKEFGQRYKNFNYKINVKNNVLVITYKGAKKTVPLLLPYKKFKKAVLYKMSRLFDIAMKKKEWKARGFPEYYQQKIWEGRKIQH